MNTVTINADQLLNQTPLHSLQIDAGRLTTALRAILPHAGDDPEIPHFHRVRLTATDTHLHLTASNGYTAGLARVDELIEAPAAEFDAELWPADLAVIAKMFKPGKDQVLTLRLDVHRDHRVTATDVSGLFDGRAYTVPTMKLDELDIARLIANQLAVINEGRSAVEISADVLRRFAATAVAYGQTLTVESTTDNGPYLVHIRDLFVGLLMPNRYDDERREEIGDEHMAWLERLA